MIRARLYVDGLPGHEEIDPQHLAEAHSRPDTLLWIDVEAPTGDEIALVATQLGVHELAAEDLAKAGQRTKLDRFPDHYFVAVRDCTLPDHELAAHQIGLVFADGWLLSVREAASDTGAALIADAMDRFERQRGEHGSNDEGFLLWALLDVVVDRYFAVTDSIDDRLEGIEEIVFAGQPESIPREIFELRRTLTDFRRVAAPLREVLSQILRKEVDCLGEVALVHFQDVFDHVLRVLDLLESQRELLTGLLEGQLAVMSNRMNQVMKATSSWGAILIVATLIAGIYGMNFRHMPELDWRLGYPLALALMGFLTALLYRVFKRRGWL